LAPQAGELAPPDRILIASLTRAQRGAPTSRRSPRVEHYAQRASPGLSITEAIMATCEARAFLGERGFAAACEGGRR
jgi:2,4-dienoyl-CoA reductase-like NADH-dependent reductase (Old Yellow Enzyme family)